MYKKVIKRFGQESRNSRSIPAKAFIKPHHWLALGAAFIATGVLLGLAPESAEATRTKLMVPIAVAEPGTAAVTLPLQLPEFGMDTVTAQPFQGEAEGAQWRTITVKQGDTLAALFAKAGISAKELHTILSLGADAKTLVRLYPGETLKLKSDAEGQLQELLYEIDPANTLHVQRSAQGFKVQKVLHPVERRIAHASATIDSSLFSAAQDAGLSDSVALELARIFGWDIDFALDLRQGDRFSAIYEEFYIDGTKIGDGPVLAAAFTNQGNTYRAIRYTDAQGNADYYTPEGLAMRKAFLRTPLEFSRVTSGFNLKRYHPILKETRAHKGVDYGAPSGTPVKAAGNGKVQFLGSKSGYGNVIILQHGGHYSTVYGHLKGFARGIKTGSHVQQGQVIGYVGMTGLATGPHLHYEFRVDGVQRNPLTVALPSAEPISPERKADFLKAVHTVVGQLEVLDRVAVALGPKATNNP